MRRSLLLLAALVALPGLALAESTFWPEFARVLTFRDYNTRVVVIGTTLLGVASGLVGTFLLLRRRSLLADAVSHATLPGICLAFLAMTIAGRDGKSLPALLAGAALTGAIGMFCVMLLRKFSRLKDDAALGIVLSVFFGIGIALLGVVSRLEQGSAAGLSSFIYGKTASMLLADALLIGGVAVIAALLCIVLFKEFALVSFDFEFAGSQGWPVFWLDLAMMSLVVIVTVIGLQSVGLILVVALLIIPPAAARFWTDHLKRLLAGSALVGGLSGMVGSATSALLPDLPAGAIIVLAAAGFFTISLLAGTARGVVPRFIAHRRLAVRIGRQNLLRALFELGETTGGDRTPVTRAALLARRSWKPRFLEWLIRSARREGLIEAEDARGVRLTEAGSQRALAVIRNHRLWEMYLIAHADIAPSHVDRDADMIEHVLDAGMIARLEAMLIERDEPHFVPASPHPLEE